MDSSHVKLKKDLSTSFASRLGMRKPQQQLQNSFVRDAPDERLNHQYSMTMSDINGMNNTKNNNNNRKQNDSSLQAHKASVVNDRMRESSFVIDAAMDESILNKHMKNNFDQFHQPVLS